MVPSLSPFQDLTNITRYLARANPSQRKGFAAETKASSCPRLRFLAQGLLLWMSPEFLIRKYAFFPGPNPVCERARVHYDIKICALSPAVVSLFFLQGASGAAGGTRRARGLFGTSMTAGPCRRPTSNRGTSASRTETR